MHFSINSEHVVATVHGIPDLSYGAENAFILRAKKEDREIGFLLIEHDRHIKSQIKFIESWTESEFLDQGLQAKLLSIAEEISKKKIDVENIPDRGFKIGWLSLKS